MNRSYQLHHHFAETNTSNPLKSDGGEPIVLLLETSFDSQYSIFITEQKDSDLIGILVEYSLPANSISQVF